MKNLIIIIVAAVAIGVSGCCASKSSSCGTDACCASTPAKKK